MRFITFTIFISIVALLTGCASSYQPRGLGGGFGETQLDTNVFSVSFRGNAYTPSEQAEEMALLRSAELTLKNGFTHFVIIDAQAREQRSSFTTPTYTETDASANSLGSSTYGSASSTTYAGQTFVMSKPRKTNTIMLFKSKPDISGMVYDASFLCDSLGKKYKVACGLS
ncbi:hypothetical protein BCF11_4183 [Collimonas sp. PA-H2]|uniref:CC0125/CC1285 family lipoprotein n=1 Tax=Collimonas sp. PA-H2 TaxID=1881062 RepID=UPI000BFA3F54|nr:hypothetical protein [Collimonas sp. PA-H2]PFH11727.1 hypothetical protein BCF11_4183 [Collimonas sp. PA-H2]